MNKPLLKKLILYIIDYLQDIEAPISTIRIIKYLYLIDYEFFLRKKEELTAINWIRYKFGPYFFEWPELICKLSIDLDSKEIIGKEYKSITYSTLEEQSIKKVVDWSTENIINGVLDKWSFEDINIILDYIYTDTEPMQMALMNQKLDFSLIKVDFNRKRKTRYLSLDKDESKKIKEILAKREKKIIRIEKEGISYDEDYFTGISQMNLEDNPEFRLNGIIALNNNVLDFIHPRE